MLARSSTVLCVFYFYLLVAMKFFSISVFLHIVLWNLCNVTLIETFCCLLLSNTIFTLLQLLPVITSKADSHPQPLLASPPCIICAPTCTFKRHKAANLEKLGPENFSLLKWLKPQSVYERWIISAIMVKKYSTASYVFRWYLILNRAIWNKLPLGWQHYSQDILYLKWSCCDRKFVRLLPHSKVSQQQSRVLGST